MRELVEHMEGINRLMVRYGVKFGIYKNNEFHEQLFPFDPLPRKISAGEYSYLERGLTQRVNALNCFLKDIYHDKKIVRDGVIPEDFIFSSKGYLPQCEGLLPPRGIYSHISGIDLSARVFDRDSGNHGCIRGRWLWCDLWKQPFQ